MPEEIDLADWEEEALEAAWERIGLAESACGDDCTCPACQQKRWAQALLEQPDLATAFPDETQDTDYSCGAAAFVAIARYFGVEPDTESEAIRSLRTSIRSPRR